MLPSLRTGNQRFQSLRVEFEAIAQELKQTENLERRRRLIQDAVRVAQEGNELVGELQKVMEKIGMFSHATPKPR
jgi:methyl-accepting chemotaxis protein